LKARHKRILKIVLFSGIVVGYLLGFGVIFNLRYVLGVGGYTGDKTFSTSVNGSSGGVNIDMYAQHRTELYHRYGYEITTFSTGDVEVLGISYADYQVRTGARLQQIVQTYYTTPIKSYSWEEYSTISGGQNYTIQGLVDVVFVVNSVNETHQILIDIGIIIELDGNNIDYEWNNISIWINVIYLSLTVIPLALLYRNIKALKFENWYNEEIKERDQKFFKILKNQSEE